MSSGSKLSGGNPLICKLARFVPLSELERSAIEHLCQKARRCRKGTDLIQEGDEPEAVFLILKGWAFRYKVLENGNRQIVAYLLPGDLCDIQIFLFGRMDHNIGLLSDSEVVKIPAHKILDIMDRFPRIERALLWATLVDEATLRGWLLNMGQRPALQRLSHLFCELCVRLSVVGLVDENGSYPLPVTQHQLADTLGLTPMHISRTLRKLREDKLISTRGRRLTILNFALLAEVSGFNKDYLHMDGPPIQRRLRPQRA